MPRGGETLHSLILGSTGTGKTTAILDLLDQIRVQGAPGITYDPDGTLIANY
jgi:Mg-chelatase subunit ChlI